MLKDDNTGSRLHILRRCCTGSSLYNYFLTCNQVLHQSLGLGTGAARTFIGSRYSPVPALKRSRTIN